MIIIIPTKIFPTGDSYNEALIIITIPLPSKLVNVHDSHFIKIFVDT